MAIQKLKEIFQSEMICMHDISFDDVIRGFVRNGMKQHHRDRLHQDVFQDMTIKKQKKACWTISRLSDWKIGCHALKTKKDLAFRKLREANVLRNKLLKSIDVANELQLHKLQPTFSSCSVMNEAKNEIMKSYPTHKTLQEIAQIQQLNYKQQIPKLDPNPRKKKKKKQKKNNDKNNTEYFDCKLLPHFPYAAVRDEINIIRFIENMINKPEFNGFQVQDEDGPDKVYTFILQILFDAARRQSYYIKKISQSHTAWTIHTPNLSTNKHSPTNYFLHALYFAPEANWNAELVWKCLKFQLHSIADRYPAGFLVVHKQTEKEIYVKIFDDLHCMDTPSLSGMIRGNEVGSTYFDSFIDGFDKRDEKKNGYPLRK